MIQSFEKEINWFVKELEIDRDERLSRAIDFNKLMEHSLPEHVQFISNPKFEEFFGDLISKNDFKISF